MKFSVIVLFTIFGALLLCSGCFSRNAVENASALVFSYPQLGLRVTLQYDPWIHDVQDHRLRSVIVSFNDQGGDGTSLTLKKSGQLAISQANLRDIGKAPQESQKSEPIHMVSINVGSATDGYRNAFEILDDTGEPCIVVLKTMQGDIVIDFSALEPIQLKTLGPPTFHYPPEQRPHGGF